MKINKRSLKNKTFLSRKKLLNNVKKKETKNENLRVCSIFVEEKKVSRGRTEMLAIDQSCSGEG